MFRYHWVFPLVPTACAYTKLNDFFWQIKQGKIEVAQTQVDFGDHLEARKSTKSKSRNFKEKWKMQIDNFGNGKCDTKYVCANGECSFGHIEWSD